MRYLRDAETDERGAEVSCPTKGTVSTIEEGDDRMGRGELVIALLFASDSLDERAEGRSREQSVLIECAGTAELAIPERELVTLVYVRIAGHIGRRQNRDFHLVQICHGPSTDVCIAPCNERGLGERVTIAEVECLSR